MSWSSALHGTSPNGDKKFKGVRRRKWGKWVSEIRVPGTQERLWLGTYSTQEAAAVAHDVAVYCLRRPSRLDKLNFPETLSSYCIQHRDMSPRSVQKVASDAGMDVDARNIVAGEKLSVAETYENKKKIDGDDDDHVQKSSVDDMLWWDINGLGDDDFVTCHASCDGEALSVSIEDYGPLWKSL